jgi:uncharacterized membrane protein
MRLDDSDRVWLAFVGQCAWLVAGSVLVLAASVLFAALMIANRAGPVLGIIALLNSAMFYLWGLGCIRYVHKTWTAAAARSKAEGKPAPLEV